MTSRKSGSKGKASHAGAKSADTLPDSDEAAIAELTGAASRDPIAKRELLGVPLERNCPPHMKNDPEFTKKLEEAHERHASIATSVGSIDANIAQQVQQLFDETDKTGGTLTLADIPEDLILRLSLRMAVDTRRPSARLKAIDLLAGMKGMKKQEATEGARAAMDDLLERLSERRQEKRAKDWVHKGLRAVGGSPQP